MTVSRQMVVGVLFTVAGAVIAALGLYQHPVDRIITIAGIVVAVLGGIVIPNSGLEHAVQSLASSMGPLIPSLKFGASAARNVPLPPSADRMGTDTPPVSPP
jgi:hypothetical protein